MPNPDHHFSFKTWSYYSELPENLLFLLEDEVKLEHYFSTRISYLKGIQANEFSCFINRARSSKFPQQQFLNISESWDSDVEIGKVRHWLFERKIAFDQEIYLIYYELVVKTQWKVFVKHWDIFSWSVGVSLYIIDSTQSWELEVHHEDSMTFSYF